METLVTKTQLVHWPQTGLLHYSLVVPLGEDLAAKVTEEKQIFCEKYKHKKSLKTPPYITLASFQAREAMEETLVRYMQRVFMQQQSFEVALNNYSGFPLHTIFLRVQNQQPLKQLVKQLHVVDNYIDSCSCSPIKPATNPQVVIANDLPEAVYLQAIFEYSQRTFHETFIVNELVLLRRNNEYDAGKSINIFGLRPAANTLYN